METKTCTMCNIEKPIDSFFKRFSVCKDCNRARGLKRYYDNKQEISNQQKQIMKSIEENYFYRKTTMEVYKLET